MDEPRLERLFERIAAGDETAEEELHQSLNRRILSITLSSRVPRGDADDVAQELFKALFEKLRSNQYSGGSKRSTWITGILRNKIADYFRAVTRLRQVPLTEELASSYDGSGPLQIRRAEVREALMRLRPDERLVLVAHVLGGVSQNDLARRLGRPIGTISSLKHRAAARFRALYGQMIRPPIEEVDDEM